MMKRATFIWSCKRRKHSASLEAVFFISSHALLCNFRHLPKTKRSNNDRAMQIKCSYDTYKQRSFCLFPSLLSLASYNS